MLDEWEMLYLGTGIVMCRRITTDRMSDSSGVHGGHGALGAGEQVQVHANVPGGRGNLVPLGPMAAAQRDTRVDPSSGCYVDRSTWACSAPPPEGRPTTVGAL